MAICRVKVSFLAISNRNAFLIKLFNENLYKSNKIILFHYKNFNSNRTPSSENENNFFNCTVMKYTKNVNFQAFAF